MRIILMAIIFSLIGFALTRCGSAPSDSPTKQSQTITFPLSKINLKIDSDLAITVTGGLGKGKITYTSSDKRIAKVDKKSAHITPITTGSVDIIATKEGDATYNSATTRFRAIISKHAQTIAFKTPGVFTKTLNDKPFINTATGGKGSGDITYSSNNPNVAKVDQTSGNVTITGSGKTSIIARKASDERYAETTAAYDINVQGKEEQTIAFAVSGTITKTVSESGFINAATGGKGTGTITYSSSAPDIARVNSTSGEVSFLRKGSVTISANKAADARYASAHAEYIIAVITPQQQRIAFTESGPISRHLNTSSFANPVIGGQGSGIITYTSSNPEVATVDPMTGRVSFVGSGSTTIMATKRADKQFSQARSSYRLNVTAPKANESDKRSAARVLGAIIPAFAAEPNTNEDNTSDPSDDASSTTTSSNNSNNESPADGDNPSTDEEESAGTDLPELSNHEMVSFQGKLWIIGGQKGLTIENHIWSSTSGKQGTWTQVEQSQRFSPRTGHQVVNFRGRLWLVGGVNKDGNYLNDIWSTHNGINWRLETSQARFSARAGHTITLFNNKLWLIGGANQNVFNDVWSSSDGKTWRSEGTTTSRVFTPRADHKSVVFNNRLWVIGGNQMRPDDGLTKSNDVWSSADGRSWTRSVASAEFSERDQHQIISYKGALWLIGGKTSLGVSNDVWSTRNGHQWLRVTSNAPFGERTDHAAMVHNGQLFLIGGGGVTFNNDVWVSNNGVNWSK